jgi:cytochrome c556
MSSRSLGTLTLDMVAKTGGLSKGLDKAGRDLDKLNTKAVAVGTVIGNVLFEVGKRAFQLLKGATTDAINNMDDLSKAAQRVSLPTEQFSALVYAGKLADVSLGTLQTSLGRLTKAQADSLKSTSEQAKVFGALGISATDASGKLRSSYDVLLDFADAFKRQEGSPEILAAGLKIFGRNFQEIIPLIKDGSDGLRSAADEAGALGQIISTETGKAAEDFNDNLTRLNTVVSGLGNAIAAELLPDLVKLTDEFVASAKEGVQFKSTAEEIANVIRVLGTVIGGVTTFALRLREVMQGLVGQAGAFGEIARGLFSLDPAQVKRGTDAYDAASRSIDRAFESRERLANARPITIIEASDLKAEEDRRIAQMRRAAAEAKRLRELAFGPDPKTGGRTGGGGKSEAQREAERLLSSYESLMASMEQRIALFGKEGEAARVRYDVERGALTGLTDAQKTNAIALAERYDTLVRVKEMEEAAADAVKKATEEYERQQQRQQGVLDQLNLEIEALGKSAEWIAKRNALLDAGVTAESDFGKAIVATVEELYRQGQAIEAQIELMDTFRSAAGNALSEVVLGTKSLKDAFVDMMDAIAERITRMIAERWIEQLFGQMGTNQTGSQGGWMSALFGAFFGGGKASGGPVRGNSLTRVNEYGVEMATVGGKDYLLTGPQGANITPAQNVGMGGGSITQIFNNPRMTNMQTDQQRAREEARKAQRAMARA